MLKELLKVANKLDALGLSKEADTIDALVLKIAGRWSHKGMGGGEDAPMMSFQRTESPKSFRARDIDFDPDSDPEETSTQGGESEGWSGYSQAEHDAWQRETHEVGLAAWKECEESGGDKEACQRAYTLAIYRNQFGRDPEM